MSGVNSRLNYAQYEFSLDDEPCDQYDQICCSTPHTEGGFFPDIFGYNKEYLSPILLNDKAQINDCTFSKELVNPTNKLKELKELCNVVPPVVQESVRKEVTTETTSQFLHLRHQLVKKITFCERQKKAAQKCDTTLIEVGSDPNFLMVLTTGV